MDDCCDPRGYQATFGAGFARRVAGRYRKHGLNRTQQRLVSFLDEHGVKDASVLEIGGGVGELQVELLRRGARQVTNLEISTSYEAEAKELLEQSGLTGRVTRLFVDIATAPDEVEPADIVVLHRVVCCYPDYQKLLTAAGEHARRLLVFSHPPSNPLTRFSIWSENFLRRLQGNAFRAFVHPPDAMLDVLRAQGLTVSYQYRGTAWTVVGLER